MTPRRAALAAALAFVLGAASAARAADQIHWTFTGPTSVTFDWRGSESAIQYGLTTAYGLSAAAVTPSPLPISNAGPWKEARITGLLPNTVYHWTLGNGDHTFRTMPLRGSSDFVVCAIGDVGDSISYPKWVPGVQNLIRDIRPHFTIMLGDLTYGNAHGQDNVDQHFNDVMKWSLDAAYMPVWGNHEYESGDDLRNYKGRFDLPNPRASPGSPSISCCGEDWWWMDYGNVRFIAYPEPWSGAWTAWAASAESLMKQVDTDPDIDFVVTMGHRPAYSSGHHPGDGTLKGHLDGLGTRHPKYVLDLCGHSHNYERTTPQRGVVHITSGDGGASHETDGTCKWLGGCPPPAYTAFRAFRHGALRLRFTPSAIEGVYVCGPADTKDDVTCTPGAALDTFSIAAPGGGIADAVPPAPRSDLRVR